MKKSFSIIYQWINKTRISNSYLNSSTFLSSKTSKDIFSKLLVVNICFYLKISNKTYEYSVRTWIRSVFSDRCLITKDENRNERKWEKHGSRRGRTKERIYKVSMNLARTEKILQLSSVKWLKFFNYGSIISGNMCIS
jgi:hypothetical protein